MKTCSNTACKQINPQPFDNFFKDKQFKDGHAARCKVCKTEKSLAWRAKNKDRYNAKMKKYQSNNYERLRLLKYNLTPEQYAKMLYDQKGVCAICQKLPQGKRPLVIDHRHSDGKVRGLLCYGCNRLLQLLDSPELLEKASNYVKAA